MIKIDKKHHASQYNYSRNLRFLFYFIVLLDRLHRYRAIFMAKFAALLQMGSVNIVENNNRLSSKKEQAREKISLQITDEADIIRKLIISSGLGIEERIAIQDQVDHISRETASILDRVDTLAKRDQTKILLAYRNFLERNLQSVNQRLKQLD